MFWLRFSFRSSLRRRRKTVVTLLAIAFGVAALIVLGAIMVGVNDTMVENAVSLWAGHVVAEQGPAPMATAVEQALAWAAKGEKSPLVRTALPRCRFPGILSCDTRCAGTLPVEICMVNPEKEREASPVARSIARGRYLHEADTGIVLGAAAISALGLEVGEPVVLTTAGNEYTLEVVGVFDTGVDALDRSIGFVSLLDHASFTESRVTVDTAFLCRPGADPELLKRALSTRATTPATKLMPWKEKLPEVAQLVDLNEFAMRVVMVLVVAILGFGVANALLISVMDRYRYYAILKAIGARPREVLTTVVGEAVIMCVAAGLLGTLVGSCLSLLWGHIGLDIGRYTSHNPHFGVNSVIHPRLTLAMALGPQGLALVAAVVASLWPGLVAARRSVSSGMRDL